MNEMENYERRKEFEAMLARSIVIPPSLATNMKVTSTSLGGVFVEYFSNVDSELDMLNSIVQLKIMLDTTDGCGRYVGDSIGLETFQYRNATPMRGIKKKKPYAIVIDKLNTWIADNAPFFLTSIESRGC